MNNEEMSAPWKEDELAGGEIHPYEALATLQEIFEQTARRFPNNIALEDATATRTFTYRELDGLANSLAVRLRNSYHVGPESLVGLAAERSIGAMVSLLAVLKAGGAYVPLGLDLPPARLQAMIEDIGPAVILCGETGAELFSH